MIYHIELSPSLHSSEVIAGYYAPSLPEQGTYISIVPSPGPNGEIYPRCKYEVFFVVIQVREENISGRYWESTLHAAAIVRQVAN